MTIEEALYSYLSTYAGLTASVGTRIYPNVIPSDASLPAVAYQRISTARVRSHEGPSNLSHTRIQFTCVADSYSAVKSVADQIRAALDGYRGTMSTLRVDGVSIENEIADYVETSDLYIQRLDALIWHYEE